MPSRARPCAVRAVLVLAVSAILAVVLIIAVWWSQRESRVQAYIKAEQQWSARPFKRYRLVTEQQGSALQPQPCRQDIEVYEERTVAVVQNTCLGIPVTVSDLLDRIDPYAAGTSCGPNGCACDGPIVVDATYDPEFGYPRFVHIGLQRPFFGLRWPLGYTSCTLIGYSADPDVTVLSLTPLP